MRIALVGEALWSMGGANHVLESLCEIYPQADIYALFGNRKYVSEGIGKHKIRLSFLNSFPFIKRIYRYTYFLWPLAIESFDLSSYDLVISASYSVAHGVLTSVDTKHIAYVHTPMRYAWDLKDMYFNKKNFSFWKRLVIPVFLTYLRTWDVSASRRADVLIANSSFVKKRIEKYWDREVDFVLNPPVNLYKGKVVKQKEKYFVAGAPFEPNKGGEFLLELAVKLKFDLKLIGSGGMYKKLKRKYNGYSNIEFLGYIPDREKFEIMTHAQGYIQAGIEEFGIFPVEALSCGTPILVSNVGGSVDYLLENVNGMAFEYGDEDSFEKILQSFKKRKWDSEEISKSVKRFEEKFFKESFEEIIK